MLCVCERERERESVCERERERESVCERERERESVFERERVCVRERNSATQVFCESLPL